MHNIKYDPSAFSAIFRCKNPQNVDLQQFALFYEDIMTIRRKLLQFINIMFANRSSTVVAERDSGRVAYAAKNKSCVATPQDFA